MTGKMVSFIVVVLAGTAWGAGCVRFATTNFSSSTTDNRVEVRDLKPTVESETRLVGTWSSKSERPGEYAQIDIIDRDANSTRSAGYGWPTKEINDLFRGPGPVHATIRREAGTLTFDGTVADDKGSGNVTWEPDGWYLKEMSRLTGETLTSRRALDLGLIGLEVSYAKQIEEAGCKASISDLISLKFAGVSADYVAGFHQAGYSFDADALRSLRFAGVEPSWAKPFKDAGYEFTADDLRSLRFSGVDSEDAARLRRADYRLSADELRSLRFSGVPADYAASLAGAGYKFSPDELRSLRFAGVGEDFAVELKKAGYNFSADELRHLRFSGVSADYANDLVVSGKQNLSADELIQLRRKGIDADTIRKLRQ